LSFFDEADEPLTEPRTRRPRGGGGRPPSRRGRSPSQQQQYLVRRIIAGAVLLVVVIVLALGIHSCEVSQRNSALRNYATSVASLVADSHHTAQSLFGALAKGGGAVAVQNSINNLAADAAAQLSRVKGLSVPDEMKPAQGNMVLTFQMRHDAIAGIAGQIQSALSKSGADAVNAIAGQIARLYGSDVLYKDYAGKQIASALHGVGITPNGLNGPPISDLQTVPNVQWLTPSFVAGKLGASVPTSSGSSGTACNSKACGDAMTSVSVSGQTLTPGGTATLPSNPPPTFDCTFSNTGQQALSNTVVRVTVQGTSVSGSATVPQTQPGGSYTVHVPLSSAPPTGTHTVDATVEPHPGESPVVHNTQTFTITFH
jgi:CARDB protein